MVACKSKYTGKGNSHELIEAEGIWAACNPAKMLELKGHIVKRLYAERMTSGME